MPLILFIFLLTYSYGEDFISPMEYAKMLYQNPRGIGCDSCHGLRGEGKVIAKYKKNGKVKTLSAPALGDISQKKFQQALNNRRDSVMPRYFLTKYEIESLYYYVTQISKEQKNK